MILKIIHHMLTFSHLLSLVFYCDYSELSTDFSSTFRKRHSYETIESIKNRNSKYYYLSKYLRECVDGRSERESGGGPYANRLLGPFYCGMSVVLSIPSFNIRLCSPTSTSKQVAVAIKFSGDAGCILQFNNPTDKGDYGSTQYSYLRCFNVSWLSRYKEEDERLFCGGFRPIKLDSVRLRKTNQNFEKFMYCLYCLEIMITGGHTEHLNISKMHVVIIKHLHIF
eukprot:475289_1